MRSCVRVLLVTPYSRASATGVGSFVRSLHSALAARGEQLWVIEPGPRTGPPGFGNLFLAIRSLRAFWRTRGAEVVHCQQLHLQSFLVGLLARALGKGVVVTVHGRSPLPRGVRGLAFRIVESLSLSIPHQLVFVAESLRSELERDGKVVPNGVAVAPIRAVRSARDDARREIGAGDAIVVVFVGRVTADKGILVLLEAWKTVRKTADREVLLLLVGPIDDDMERMLGTRQQAGTGIRAIGAVSNTWRILVAADLFVLPSFREGLPLSLLEAMAAGLPVVTTNVGDIRHVVEHRTTGLLVPPGNPDALAEAIVWILQHPSEASELGRRAADVVASSYDLSSVAEAYLGIYHGALTKVAASTPP